MDSLDAVGERVELDWCSGIVIASHSAGLIRYLSLSALSKPCGEWERPPLSGIIFCGKLKGYTDSTTLLQETEFLRVGQGGVFYSRFWRTV